MEKLNNLENYLKIIGRRKLYSAIKDGQELRWIALEDMVHNEL
jgi:hypothetical protein